MKQNRNDGFFVAIDVQNDLDMSEVIEGVQERLKREGADLYWTQEPTKTELGVLLCEKMDVLKGDSLACLMAADRYAHLEQEIVPNLQQGKIVVSNRFLLSSLVRQEEDHVREQYTVEVNRHIIKPDLQIVILEEDVTLPMRIWTREEIIKRKKLKSTNDDFLNTLRAAQVLEQLNIKVAYICSRQSREESINQIYEEIMDARDNKILI